MKRLYAVIRSRGPGWDSSRSMEEQREWREHAEYMDRLEAEGFIVLGGPLEGTSNVLLIVDAEDDAEIRARLAGDSWTRNGVLREAEMHPWVLRLGSLPREGARRGGNAE